MEIPKKYGSGIKQKSFNGIYEVLIPNWKQNKTSNKQHPQDSSE